MPLSSALSRLSRILKYLTESGEAGTQGSVRQQKRIKCGHILKPFCDGFNNFKHIFDNLECNKLFVSFLKLKAKVSEVIELEVKEKMISQAAADHYKVASLMLKAKSH